MLLSFLIWEVPLLSAQERTYYSLVGRVTQPDGSPAGRAAVSITGPSGVDQQALADDMGRFEVQNLLRGRYRCTAKNPSAPEQFSEPVEIDIGRASPLRVSVNIYLRSDVRVTPARENKPGSVSLAETMQLVPKPAQKAFEQALKLRHEKKFGEAIKSFTRAIDAYPAFFQALAERGHLRIVIGDVAAASDDFARALELDSKYGPALRGSGMCKFQQGQYAEAVHDLELAADVEPGNAMNYLFMGTADVALDRRDQARAALRKALSIDPSGAARAHVHLANLCIKENKPQEALAEIEVYLETVPNAPDKDRLATIASQLRSSIRN